LSALHLTANGVSTFGVDFLRRNLKSDMIFHVFSGRLLGREQHTTGEMGAARSFLGYASLCPIIMWLAEWW
jgi:hypothetical protein